VVFACTHAAAEHWLEFAPKFDSTAREAFPFPPPTASMNLNDPDDRLFQLWRRVRIERASRFSLFTFGESTLPYYLVLQPAQRGDLVALREGTVKITRPTIITPGNAIPEFQNFFEETEGEDLIRFLLSRSAAFQHLKFNNSSSAQKTVSDSVEETVAQLNARLDAHEEEGTAILTAPHDLGWMALMRYAAEQVIKSGPDNVQELRERGFLDY
jgi:hypothetical protein